jgi:hypothetical protein
MTLLHERRIRVCHGLCKKAASLRLTPSTLGVPNNFNAHVPPKTTAMRLHIDLIEDPLVDA